jgi:YVTN family beta-propeller protein
MPAAAVESFRDAVRGILVLVLCGLLFACGGEGSGGDGTTSPVSAAVSTPGVASQATASSSVLLRKASDAWIPIPDVADPLLQSLAIPADAPTRGMWSASKPWPLNAIHTSLLPDGRLLTFGTPFDSPAVQDGRFYDIWNPSQGFGAGSHASSTVPDYVNSFCSTAAWQPDGRLLISGGNGNGGKSSGLFSTTTLASTNTGATLAAERWYATMLTLPDGRSLVLGGTVPYGTPVTSQTPEILENGQWRSLFGASSTPIFGVRQLESQPEANPWYYPRSWVAPDGSVFGITSNILFRMRPDDNNRTGSITRIGTFKTPQDTSGATTPNVGFTSSAVMFEPGRILQVGGNGVTDNSPNLASQQATIIDINGTSPTITETAPMSYRRYWLQATVLPAGQVVATGGTSVGWDPANASRPAEIWDPRTGKWTVGAGNVETRSYHSSGLLLPNGTVFTAGGGAPGAVNNLNAEIYYPPQLFRTVNGAAQLAPRPVFKSVSTLSGSYGNPVGATLATDAALSQMTLVALGNVTHSFNNTQRRIPLQFTQAGTEVQATLPANANLAPPGYYMLFAVDANGVSSRGTFIALGGLPAPVLNGFSQIPSTATACAGENGTCAIPAGQQASVYYGVGTSFALRSGLTGAVICNNDTFGDPIPGLAKSCSYVLETAGNAVAPFTTPVVAAGTAATYTPETVPGATYSWLFGDGSAPTAFATSPNASHVFAAAGVYNVTFTMRSAVGAISSRTFLQAVASPATAQRPSASSALALETRTGASTRLWVANPDSDSVAVIDTGTNARVAEIAVGGSPRSVAIAPDGRVWVTNKNTASISILNPATLSVAATVALPRASQPHGLVFARGGSAYVVLEGLGQLRKLDASSGATQATLDVGANPRHLSISGDGATVLVSRFITPPLPGESTASVGTATGGGEVLVIGSAAMTVGKTVLLRHSDKVDGEQQGGGVPNYLAAAAIAPDGKSAWVPSKQDNVRRGTLRSGQGLDFQNTVRAISSRIDLASLAEDYARRVDHDNSSLGAAAVFHPSSAYLFVALETSRQMAVVDAANGRELAKFDVGRAPQAIALSADGNRVFVQNFMDRTVSMLDMSRLTTLGQLDTAATVTVATSAADKLSAQVRSGKQLFYDARDTRLARDSYMSCATCHADGGHDGRTWDFTGFGEGLRNTIALKGRAGMGHGFTHWSANGDEIQDFEKQIRDFAGGTGLMTDAQYGTGTRAQPLGDRKAGVSADLDALAAYLGSLDTFAPSPLRNADASLTTAAQAGKAVFATANCASCHAGAAFTISADASALRNVGTLRTTSGQRLGATLGGIDVPTLRDVWATAPYLHDGRAPTLAAAVQAHSGVNLAATDLTNLVSYLQQIGAEEPAPVAGTGGTGGTTTPAATPPSTAVGCGTEGQGCTIPAGGTATVWYGANGQWAVKTGASGIIGCNNGVFGDPIAGVAKSCRYVIDTPATSGPTPPASATACASEGQGCTIPAGGTATVWYGANGQWAVKTGASGTIGCNNGVFGDPIPGVAKSCRYVLDTPATSGSVPPATASICASEGQGCTIPAGVTATVWYGANGQWAVKTGVVGTIACNNGVFTDPIPGVAKSCRYA